MSKKYLHVKNDIVTAVTLPGEAVGPYGEVVEVALDLEVQVGDTFKVKREEAQAVAETAEPAQAESSPSEPAGDAPKAKNKK